MRGRLAFSESFTRMHDYVRLAILVVGDLSLQKVAHSGAIFVGVNSKHSAGLECDFAQAQGTASYGVDLSGQVDGLEQDIALAFVFARRTDLAKRDTSDKADGQSGSGEKKTSRLDPRHHCPLD